MEPEVFVVARDLSVDDMLTRRTQIFRVVMVDQKKIDPDLDLDGKENLTEGVWLRNISTGVNLTLDSDEFDAHEFERVRT